MLSTFNHLSHCAISVRFLFLTWWIKNFLGRKRNSRRKKSRLDGCNHFTLRRISATNWTWMRKPNGIQLWEVRRSSKQLGLRGLVHSFLSFCSIPYTQAQNGTNLPVPVCSVHIANYSINPCLQLLLSDLPIITLAFGGLDKHQQRCYVWVKLVVRAPIKK